MSKVLISAFGIFISLMSAAYAGDTDNITHGFKTEGIYLKYKKSCRGFHADKGLTDNNRSPIGSPDKICDAYAICNWDEFAPRGKDGLADLSYAPDQADFSNACFTLNKAR